MLLFFKLSFRNLIRNRVRTFLNLIMIVGAFCSIVVFRGFTNYMMGMLETSMTEGLNGHIQIAKTAIWNEDYPKQLQEAYIENHQSIETLLKSVPGVKYAAGRANTYVLLINGDKSVGAYARGYDPRVEPNIEKVLTLVDGKGFSKAPQYEILIGAGLQKNLQIKMGQTVSLVSQTLSNSMSSVDLEVRGSVKTGMTEIDESTVFIPLYVAQKLLSTERVERITVLLDKDKNLNTATNQFKTILKDFPEIQIKDWRETSTFYRQLTDFHRVQNSIIEIILATLVFFGILNTLGMSIYERIGEIGTLRALGDRRETVLLQLVLEGLLLGLTGALLATPLAHAISLGFSSLELLVLMPGASQEVPVHIEPSASDYFASTMIVCITCLLAILWPAQRAVRLTIVDALRANS